jgi:hypothetical protein
MEQMTQYMGMMVYNTGAMAAVAERMERRSDRLLHDIEKKGTSTERTVQNITQAFLDNDKAAIKNLQGIRQELSELKQGLPGTPPRDAGAQKSGSEAIARESAAQNALVHGKLMDLERKLNAIAARLESVETRK